MEGFLVIIYIIMFVWGILNIILFFKIWEMTGDIRDIKNYFLRKDMINESHNESNQITQKDQNTEITDDPTIRVGDKVIHKETLKEYTVIKFALNGDAAVCKGDNEEITYYLNSLKKKNYGKLL